jgi:hypothetical protein
MFTPSTAARGGSPGRSVTRSIAAFCTAALASAALVVMPLSANADEATDALAAVAAEARAAADEADVIADAAEAAAAEAADQAAQLRADSDAAAALAVTATEALAASPEDAALIDALAAAIATAAAADGLASEAEQASADAAALAAEARAAANGLEEAALAAEAELEAALNPPPSEEVVETEGDQVQETQKFILNPCDTHSLDSFTAENKSSWEWCTPEPEIEIYVKNVCPTEVYVKISNLIPWGDYEVWVNGVKHEAMQDDGKIEFTVTDFADGKFEVKVKYGKDKWTKDHEYVKADCPSGKAEVERACKAIDGDAEVKIAVWDLSKWREYTITVSGPGGYVKEFDVSWADSWHKELDLYPGDYTVTIESDDNKKPHIGPVSFTFTVAPCPGEVVITITPVCAVTSTGSLGAVLSGLVVGREYHVTVTGSGGSVITDTTFTATSSSWAVPPANIAPGTYTVTVVDTHSHAAYVHTLDEKNRPPKQPKEPLTWTATGTVTSCPPITPANLPTLNLPTLAKTGAQLGSTAYLGLLLLPVGAGLLLARRRQNRREAGLEETE